jgi:hypothetical protein
MFLNSLLIVRQFAFFIVVYIGSDAINNRQPNLRSRSRILELSLPHDSKAG